jgi:hypothetical protein
VLLDVPGFMDFVENLRGCVDRALFRCLLVGIRCVFAVYSLSLVGFGGVPLWFTVQFALIRCAFLTCPGSWTLSRTSGGAWTGPCFGVYWLGFAVYSLCIRCDWLGLVGIGWDWLGLAGNRCGSLFNSL